MNQGVGNKILETLPQRIDKQHVLFFDMDGTLIDTNYANYLSYTQAIQQVLKTESDISYAPDIRFTRMHLKKYFPLSKRQNMKNYSIEKQLLHRAVV